MTHALSEEALKAIGIIEKLLNLAAKAGTPEEGALAAAKAQELLAKHNLDASVIEAQGGAADGRREESHTRGGVYGYQRDLWTAVARMNFCLYWTQTYKAEHRGRVREMKRHRIVGKLVNVRSSIVIAQYLEQAIERITREELQGDTKRLFSRWAISFREGAVQTIVRKLDERYRQRVREDELKAAEAAKRSPGSSRALTLTGLAQSEYDANVDFVYGEGYTARYRARQAEHDAKVKQAQADYDAWRRNNPEEAKRQDDIAAKEAAKAAKREAYNASKRKGRAYNPNAGKQRDWEAYSEGKKRGHEIGLDEQVDRKSHKQIADC